MSAVIVHIDPDISVQQTMKQILSSANLESRLVTDPHQALEIIAKEPVRLILSEWGFASMGGEEFLKRMKKEYPHIPVIIVSSLRDPDGRLTALRAGAIDFITKPFERNLLLAKIQNILAWIDQLKSDVSPQSEQSNLENHILAELRASHQRQILPQQTRESPGGYTYSLPNVEEFENLDDEAKIALLEKLVQKKLLKRKIFEILQACPDCGGTQLIIRTVCPNCNKPLFHTAPDGSYRNVCNQCGAEFRNPKTLYRCVACAGEFPAGTLINKSIYAYELLEQYDKNKHHPSILTKLAFSYSMDVFPQDLFEPFLAIERRYHGLRQQPFGMVSLRIAGITRSATDKHKLRVLSNVLLVLKKELPPAAVLFEQGQIGLVIFFPYTPFTQIKVWVQRVKRLLERLGLIEHVNLNIQTQDPEGILQLLEQHDSMDEGLP